jgi:hypothetical protein
MAGNLTRYDFVKCEDGWELETQGRRVGLPDYKNEILRRDGTVQRILDELSGGEGTVSVHTEVSGIEKERREVEARAPQHLLVG